MMINEIFYSIQGESTFAGRPCVFVRLTGCNLRCTYCDTRYAYDEGRRLEIVEILARVAGFGCNLVEITGGEPLLQEETPDLTSLLLENGYRVLMETNGSFDISSVPPACIKVMDVKCPGSGEADKCELANLERLSPLDQVKFVIGSREDYQYARSVMARVPMHVPRGNLLFSPVQGALPASRLADWMLADRLDARLQLQLHKTIWPDVERGV